MTVRIHFTSEDLARTHLADGPRPLVELHMALRALQEPRYPVRFAAWRHHAVAHLRPRTRQLLDLVPAGGYSTDFCFPVQPSTAEEALEHVRSSTSSYLRQDLQQWSQLQPGVPSWAWRLAAEPDMFQHLVDVLDHAYTQVVAPFWPRIQHLAQADRALRLKHLTDHGMDGLLTRLNPRRLRWIPPVLEADTVNGRDEDLHLNGRGLLLIPSLFRSSFPAINDGTNPQPWLTFPLTDEDRASVLPPTTTATTLSPTPRSLAALLGHTRAAVLCTIADHPTCTTTELARHAHIAPSSASQHATVLRAAGLVDVTRQAHTAHHTLTPLGQALLNPPHL